MKKQMWFGVGVMLFAMICVGCAKQVARRDPAQKASAPTLGLRGQVMAGSGQQGLEVTPGLGTAYGRSISSYVRFTPFVRASSRPFSVLKLYYNDPQGVYAMARSLHRHCCVPMSVQDGRGLRMELVSFGRVLRGLRVAGRAIVMGHRGARYGIHLYNETPVRVEVVVSVDGLDVIDGRRASIYKRGYVLQPHGAMVIQGFRRSRYQVAAFRFSSIRRSYASRTGQGGNIGVIGVAAFAEQSPSWTPRQLVRRLDATPFAEAF